MRNTLTLIVGAFIIAAAGYFFYVSFFVLTSNLDFLAQANEKAKEVDPSAFVYSQKASDIDQASFKNPMEAKIWEYLAYGDEKGVISLRFNGATWKVEEKGDMKGGPKRIDLKKLVTMEVKQAWESVQGAGLQAPLVMWELFQPMSPTGGEYPIYFFTTTNGIVKVDTSTFEVINNLPNGKK